MARKMMPMQGALRLIVTRSPPVRQTRGLASENVASASAPSEQPGGTSRLKGTLGKRFYKMALVKPAVDAKGLAEVCLDHRVLRTPAKKPLRFPNPALAHAIAAEWEWQDRSGVRSFTMPLMKLASISVDQIPKDKERVIATILKYCHTDALCCRASPGSVLHVENFRGSTDVRKQKFVMNLNDWKGYSYSRKMTIFMLVLNVFFGYEDKKADLTVARAYGDFRELSEGGTMLHTLDKGKQVRHWDPLLDWVESEVGSRPVVSSSIFGANQPQEFVNSLEKCLRGLNDWQLAAIDSLAGSARSFVVAWAIYRSKLNIDQAIEIIRLEENHQVEDWGYVEGGHDIDEADIRVRISAASVFLRLI